MQQGQDSGIDLAWLQDQLPDLQSPLAADKATKTGSGDELIVIEVQQFRPPQVEGLDGDGAAVKRLLAELDIRPSRV